MWKYGRDKSMSTEKNIRLVTVSPCGFNLQINFARIIWTHYKNYIGGHHRQEAIIINAYKPHGDLSIRSCLPETPDDLLDSYLHQPGVFSF